MTTEEIINEIKCLLSELNSGENATSYLTQNDVKWLNESIKALEQESTTKYNLAQERYQDLIEYFGDKETAKIILEDKKEFKAWLKRIKWHVKRSDELARKLDTVSKKGHWKHNKCDVCGASRPPLFDNYCPNCGARMI